MSEAARINHDLVQPEAELLLESTTPSPEITHLVPLDKKSLQQTLEEVTDPEFPSRNITVAEIKLGSKRLALRIVPTGGFISEVTTTDKERVPQETTKCYAALKETLQTIADVTQTAVHYQLSTSNPQMTKWAETTGAELFHWSTINASSDYLQAEVVIEPQS
jgi:hypothetical protein